MVMRFGPPEGDAEIAEALSMATGRIPGAMRVLLPITVEQQSGRAAPRHDILMNREWSDI